MAGAQGEFAGVAMIQAYHASNGDMRAYPDHRARCRARHQSGHSDGVWLRCRRNSDPPTATSISIACVKWSGRKTAGIMLTNPSTLGVFERQIQEIAAIVHEAGGLLYYDGANLNAILGKTLPGDMGFDVVHMNLHKTFSTPHGGGGPGSGAVGVSERLRPFLPMPLRRAERTERYEWATEAEVPQSIGRLSAFMGNSGVLIARLCLHAHAGQGRHGAGV